MTSKDQSPTEQSPKTTEQSLREGVEVMLAGVRSIPDQIIESLSLGAETAEMLLAPVLYPFPPRHIALCGLGGSAFPGELLELATQAFNVRCPVSRDYTAPSNALPLTQLNIACSFSGNTEETLSAFLDALETGQPTIAVCTGGALETLAVQFDAPCVKLTKPTPTFQPRAATGMFIGVIGGLLDDLGLAPGLKEHLRESAEELRVLMSDPTLKQRAKEIAGRLSGKIPVFYAPQPFGPVAQVCKIKINENAKSPAFWNALPEFNHNEMVGYTRMSEPFVVVMLSDEQGYPRAQTRTQQSIKTLSDYGVDTLEVPIPAGQSDLARALSALYLFDLVSCELAIEAGVDPNPVEMIENFKAALGPFENMRCP